MAAIGGLAGVATAVSTAATLAGSFIKARGALAAGKAAEQQAEYEAAQYDIKAKEEQAAGQREAQEYERKRDLALSELQAKSAASGFTATDPTSLALADEISRYGTYQAQMAQYGGKSRRTGLEGKAAGRRLSGKAARQGAKYSAAGTIVGGVGDAFGKYANYAKSSGGSSSGRYYG